MDAKRLHKQVFRRASAPVERLLSATQVLRDTIGIIMMGTLARHVVIQAFRGIDTASVIDGQVRIQRQNAM